MIHDSDLRTLDPRLEVARNVGGRLKMTGIVPVYLDPNLVNMRLWDVNRNVQRQDKESDQQQCSEFSVTQNTLSLL